MATTKAFSDAGCSSGNGTKTAAKDDDAVDGCAALKLEMDVAVQILAASVGVDRLHDEVKAAQDAYTAAGCGTDVSTNRKLECNALKLELESSSEIFNSATAPQASQFGKGNADGAGSIEDFLNLLQSDMRGLEDEYAANGCRTKSSTACSVLKMKVHAATEAYAAAQRAAQAGTAPPSDRTTDTAGGEPDTGDSDIGSIVGIALFVVGVLAVGAYVAHRHLNKDTQTTSFAVTNPSTFVRGN